MEHGITLAADERLDRINENVTLIQKKNGLTFGTDAYLLSAFVRRQRTARCVDLGSGTGVIPLLLCAVDKVRVSCAVEIQRDFASLIARNAAHNQMQTRVLPLCADVRDLRPSFLPAEMGQAQVDMVTANPPYMRINAGARNREDAKYLARHEVCGDIVDFCACAARLLHSGGSFYCVYRPDRLSTLMRAMAQNRLEPKRMAFVHADAESEPSMVLIEARLDGAPALRLLPPLILHDVDSRPLPSRPLSAQAQKIYDTMCWYDTEEGK
ncbi:MAG: methyltransferase [Clostridia bacterium]|nr:methyltransferase [Clostridia bacterium]